MLSHSGQVRVSYKESYTYCNPFALLVTSWFRALILEVLKPIMEDQTYVFVGL
jgi:hypothetical protein